jgi:hypothetical protein
MANFKVYKSISAIPTPYEANAIYFVRVGLGFDLYMADSTGTNVFKSNEPTVPELTTSITYNPNGTVNVVTTSMGTKTMAYNPDGTLASITGTGIYKNKAFSYSSGTLTSVTVS